MNICPISSKVVTKNWRVCERRPCWNLSYSSSSRTNTAEQQRSVLFFYQSSRRSGEAKTAWNPSTSCFSPFLSAHTSGGGAYGLYHPHPPGGHPDVLASLLLFTEAEPDGVRPLSVGNRFSVFENDAAGSSQSAGCHGNGTQPDTSAPPAYGAVSRRGTLTNLSSSWWRASAAAAPDLYICMCIFITPERFGFECCAMVEFVCANKKKRQKKKPYVLW